MSLQAGSTQPPTLLTEADLIDKMDKGYQHVGRLCNADLSRPDLRASMERDMTLIARGVERKEDVIQRHVGTVAEVFRLLRVHIALLDEQLQRIFPPPAASDAESRVLQSNFCVCAKCGSSMDLMDTGGGAQGNSSRRGRSNARHGSADASGDPGTDRFLVSSTQQA
ncbi:DNA topoisomerase III alpha, putative [Eimeria necatrix]|uniref:DNA topoisomerase n=1 Tax=Eimeria necatrix TaxID=51315 RepID=U6MN93_9EIME|nr:DNA topoisomerase III alpha, putative [Eimeria necatrix]CDJ65506.1 DNA topoisomerase III alpha, putative [Eimeria necatrix]